MHGGWARAISHRRACDSNRPFANRFVSVGILGGVIGNFITGPFFSVHFQAWPPPSSASYRHSLVEMRHRSFRPLLCKLRFFGDYPIGR
jgi:hypothetical protein